MSVTDRADLGIVAAYLRGISTRRLEASCSTKKLCAIVATEVAIDPSRR